MACRSATPPWCYGAARHAQSLRPKRWLAAPGARRMRTFHDKQCQMRNPRPGLYLHGYLECGWIDQQTGDHDDRRLSAKTVIRSGEPEREPEAEL
jgi:hypothetical protein